MGIFNTVTRTISDNLPQIIGGIIGGPGGRLVTETLERGDSGEGTRGPTGTWGTDGSTLLMGDRLVAQTGPTTLGSDVGVDVFQPQATQETMMSGERIGNMYENGPSQAGVGSLVPFAQQLGRTIFGTGAGAVGGAVGGAVISQGVSQFMGGDDMCGCGPRAFVRLDKCGRPIITRQMQMKAKEMVMCMGIENAAAALGISVPLLAEIAFKKFKPRARGISGAQLKTARRVNNRVMKMAKDLKKACR